MQLIDAYRRIGAKHQGINAINAYRWARSEASAKPINWQEERNGNLRAGWCEDGFRIIVTVTCDEHGSADCDPYISEVTRDMAAEAISEAKRALESIMQPEEC